MVRREQVVLYLVYFRNEYHRGRIVPTRLIRESEVLIDESEHMKEAVAPGAPGGNPNARRFLRQSGKAMSGSVPNTRRGRSWLPDPLPTRRLAGFHRGRPCAAGGLIPLPHSDWPSMPWSAGHRAAARGGALEGINRVIHLGRMGGNYDLHARQEPADGAQHQRMPLRIKVQFGSSMTTTPSLKPGALGKRSCQRNREEFQLTRT